MLDAGTPDGRPGPLPSTSSRGCSTTIGSGDGSRRGRRAAAGLARGGLRAARSRVTTTSPTELAATGVPASIQHDDLHGGNIVVGPDGDRFFDWGDGVIAHPFSTLTATFNSIAYHTGRTPDDPAFGRLLRRLSRGVDRPRAARRPGQGGHPGSRPRLRRPVARLGTRAAGPRAGRDGRPRRRHRRLVDGVRRPTRAPAAGSLDDEVRRQVGRGRVGGLQPGQRVGQDRRHGQVAEPVAVRRDDVPGRRRGRGPAEHVVERRLVVVPALALVEIADRELPALGRVVVAGLEALALLVAVDRQEELDDGRAAGGQRSPRSG